MTALRRYLVLLAVCAAWCMNVQALTARQLKEGFDADSRIVAHRGSSNDMSLAMTSVGYVTAIYDVLTSNSINGFRACVPPTVEPEEQIRIVAAYLKNHPEDLSNSAEGEIAIAFGQQFPCSKRNP